MKKQFLLLGLLLLTGCVQESNEVVSNDTLVIFHKNRGPMCLEELEWLESMQGEHPDLMVKEYLTTKASNQELLEERINKYNSSQGVSSEFNYLPITFYKGQAFSGFNEAVRNELRDLIISE